MDKASAPFKAIAELEEFIKERKRFRGIVVVSLVNSKNERPELDEIGKVEVQHATPVINATRHLTIREFATMFYSVQEMLSDMHDEAVEMFGEQDFKDELQLVNQTIVTLNSTKLSHGEGMPLVPQSGGSEGFQDFFGKAQDDIEG